MSQKPPLRVLIVEDELLIAMEIEALVVESGHEVAGPLATVNAALAFLETERVDAALLDVSLRGEPIYPVAEALTRTGTPFLVLTGHAREALPEEWRSHYFAKPFHGRALRQAVETLLG